MAGTRSHLRAPYDALCPALKMQATRELHGASALFLDRDGVLVRGEMRAGKSHAPRRLEDFRLLPGAVEAVRTLRERGFVTIVVTNQPDIGNGLVQASVVEAMTRLTPF